MFQPPIMAIFREVFLEGYIIYNIKTIYKYKILRFTPNCGIGSTYVVLPKNSGNLTRAPELIVVGLSYRTVQSILVENLNMRRISARFVPRLLSDDHKVLRVSGCRKLKQQARDNPNFISNIITSDQTWVYG